MRSLSIGATGMLAQQLNVEVISHNIANMNTTSYQRRRAVPTPAPRCQSVSRSGWG